MKKQWRSLRASENYKDQQFNNLSDTPVMAEGASYGKILKAYFKRPVDIAPLQPLPSVKTDLKTLYSEKPVVIWFGHSSYLVHCKGINILVDPVFSGHASPMRGMIKAYPGANTYQVEDMPVIDLLVITHNHYDHLDTKTVAKLKSKIKAVYTPLGVGKSIDGCFSNHLPITEMDWWETETVSPFITLTATPARHFSGRGLKRAGSLWASFVLKIHGYTIYLGGDSGYDAHFKAIGEKYGPFDIAILECGQYGEDWPFIHMFPEQTVQASIDLKAKVLLPVHWGKFTLANHPWNEPVQRLVKAATAANVTIATPKQGEPVIIDEAYPVQPWWL
jgi:L-ascorbate metabolism protein UlaG (beta-lactamase superfamily)